MGDDDAGDRGLVEGGLSAGGEFAPDRFVHVLAAEFGDLLDLETGEGGELGDGGDEGLDRKRGGSVTAARGLSARDRAAGSEKSDAGEGRGGGRHEKSTGGQLGLGARGDPVGDELDLGRTESGFAVSGHEFFVVGWEGDASVEVALFKGTGDDRWSAVAALHEERVRIHAEVTLVLGGFMAGDTVFLEDRCDLGGKQRGAGRLGGGRRSERHAEKFTQTGRHVLGEVILTVRDDATLVAGPRHRSDARQ